jgi:hypothetical protein
MISLGLGLVGFSTFWLSPVQAAVIKTYNISGPIPYTALDFFFVPFTVPSGTAEIEVSHLQTDLNTTNILDWGVNDARGVGVEGFRGWGGGNHEPAVIGQNATSRSYLTGDIIPGTWNVVVGKPRIATPPGHMSINITLRDKPTLAAQTERQPYRPSAPLEIPAELTWYAGDFHVHDRESGDAFTSATLDEIADFATTQGLDFVHFSDHNTVSAAEFMVDAQPRHPKLLMLPGVEYTTYFGHGGALFTTQYVDHKIGVNGVTIARSVDAIHAQGGLFSINHFNMYERGTDLRNKCVGCAWDLSGDLPISEVDAMEVAIQKWSGVGWVFSPHALEWWDHLHALGHTQIAPLGGSDDHHGGQNESHTGSSLGSPTTMVLAANLSHSAVFEAIRLGRTVLKMENSLDPDLDLFAFPAAPQLNANDKSLRIAQDRLAAPVRVGGTVPAGVCTITLLATVSLSPAQRDRAEARGGLFLALVRNNEQTFATDVAFEALTKVVTSNRTDGKVIDKESFNFQVTVGAPLGGVDRWRAEVHDAEAAPSGDLVLRTLTNHIFFPACA